MLGVLGCTYEMVFLARWPVRTVVELIVLFAIYGSALKYWNRKY